MTYQNQISQSFKPWIQQSFAAHIWHWKKLQMIYANLEIRGNVMGTKKVLLYSSNSASFNNKNCKPLVSFIHCKMLLWILLSIQLIWFFILGLIYLSLLQAPSKHVLRFTWPFARDFRMTQNYHILIIFLVHYNSPKIPVSP